MNSQEYNSRLQKGGALLDDMRLLVRAWTDTSANEQRDIQVVENLLGKTSRSRAADTYQRAFVPRFVNGVPKDAWKIVRPLEDREIAVEVLKPVYYWITARSDKLLYEFVREELSLRNMNNLGWIDSKETASWITNRIGRSSKKWTPTVTAKVARGLLATLRDFGILEGASKKRIAPTYLPVESFAYIAFALNKLGASGRQLLEHPDWGLFLFSLPVAEQMMLEADRNQLLSYAAVGQIVRIEFPATTFEEMADVIAGKSN